MIKGMVPQEKTFRPVNSGQPSAISYQNNSSLSPEG